jgi:hypothetical protein
MNPSRRLERSSGVLVLVFQQNVVNRIPNAQLSRKLSASQRAVAIDLLKGKRSSVNED